MSQKNTPAPDSANLERLQKVLASAGYGSRRQCEELIVAGRVTIDKKPVFELGTKVDPKHNSVHVDGELLRPPRLRYFVLNKPIGVVSTASDPWARLRVIDLVDAEERLFTVGRLDKDTTGLILVTNDGQLANGLAHPRYEVAKTYQATVLGKPSADVLRQLRKGIHLSEAYAKMQSVSIKKPHPKKSTLEIVLTEGKNREIRRLLARVGHKVLQLKRVAFGSIRLGELPLGAYRELTRDEIKSLYANIQGTGRKRKSNKKTQPRKMSYNKGKGGLGKGKRPTTPSQKLSSAQGKKSAATGMKFSKTRKKTSIEDNKLPFGTGQRSGVVIGTDLHTKATKAKKATSIKKKAVGRSKVKRRPLNTKTKRRR